MKKVFTILLLAGSLLTGCEDAEVAKGTPKCIKEKIESFAKETICEDEVKVDEYLFQDETVYLFAEGNCIADGGAKVYNADCQYIGYLGGFGGLNDINGVDFRMSATFQRTVWEK
ncbi:hypothetical protein LRS06_16430 [Hymenobacter sp. J193]|uniref:DUF6970 domain-containing protein n=1 Tax=Hymenobacter sp. J193 TaxID=2898429 RepID=UPI00215145F1|nr:hypothetical protein [Hymenobacter sp. J193]MCR5889323.1 hypothetical protein [Hymenobacter sp. J193]